MPYRFTKSISVERTPYKAGHVVADDVLPTGTIRSMLRLRQIEHVDELPEPGGSVDVSGDELTLPEQPKPEKQKAAKPKKAGKQSKPSEPIEPPAESPETPFPAEQESEADNQ